MLTINATIRTEKGKGASRRLRRNNSIPAIIYGGFDSISASAATTSVATDKVWHEPVSITLDQDKINQIVSTLNQGKFRAFFDNENKILAAVKQLEKKLDKLQQEKHLSTLAKKENILSTMKEVEEKRKELASIKKDSVYNDFIIALLIDGQETRVRIKAVQHHSFKPKVIHVDFIRVA